MSRGEQASVQSGPDSQLLELQSLHARRYRARREIRAQFPQVAVQSVDGLKQLEDRRQPGAVRFEAGP